MLATLIAERTPRSPQAQAVEASRRCWLACVSLPVAYSWSGLRGPDSMKLSEMHRYLERLIHSGGACVGSNPTGGTYDDRKIRITEPGGLAVGRSLSREPARQPRVPVPGTHSDSSSYPVEACRKPCRVHFSWWTERDVSSRLLTWTVLADEQLRRSAAARKFLAESRCAC